MSTTDEGPARPAVAVYTHETFLAHDTGMHPECIARIEVSERALREDAALSGKIAWLRAGPAADESLLRCHSARYIARIDDTAGEYGRLDHSDDLIYSPETAEAARLAAGAAMDAVERCWRGELPAAFCLARPPGHHALREHAMGFCFFNSVAVATRHLQSLGCGRVLIVDWDVHHGNGTADIFGDDASVFYYSLHQAGHWPFTGAAGETGRSEGAGTLLHRPLPAGTPASEFRELFDADLERIVADFAPEFALISAGFDAHRDDPLGGLCLDDDDFAWLTTAVCRRFPPSRVVSTLEGGYNLEALARSVVAHVRALAGFDG